MDGVDLTKIGLSDVRGRRNDMFILPQDPAVFAGTIRSNLDPFHVHSESEIMNALTLVKFPGADISLEKLMTHVVDEGGSNLSAGEKQLLCLGRAMLANPRLLVLDEATSAVDRATDEFVQKMLRSQFPQTTCECRKWLSFLLTMRCNADVSLSIANSTHNCPQN